MGLMAGIGSLVGGISGLFGDSGSGSVPMPQMFQMPGMGGAANSAQTGINALSNFNTYGQNLPFAQDIAMTHANNPYGGGMMPMAGQVGGQLGGAGLDAMRTGNMFQTGAQEAIPYATQMLNMGFDPQGALYDRTMQRVQEQARAANQASGVGGTPYGAGVEGGTMANFNLDWLDRALGRANAGAQGAEGIWGGAEKLGAAGLGMNEAGGSAAMKGATLPYATFNQMGQDSFNWLNTLGGYGQNASQIPQMQVQDWLNYIGAGNQAGGVANQTGKLGLDQQAQMFKEQQTYGNQIGGGLASLGMFL